MLHLKNNPRETETPTEEMALSSRRLGFSVTKACPLSCSHCSVSASPAPELAKSTFTAAYGDHVAAQIPALKEAKVAFIDFTGGEPTLASAFVRRVSRAAKENDILTGIVTAAHWAATPDRARKFVDRFADIDNWDISTDLYHLPFVALDNVRHAYEALREVGKQPCIRIAYHEPMSLPDAELIDQVRGFAGDHIGFQPISPVGRGSEIGVSIRKSKGDYDKDACPTTGLLVRPGGNVEACCAPLSNEEMVHPLRFGNAFEEPLSVILHRWRTNPLLQTIRLWGFEPVFKWLEEDGYDLARIYNGRVCLQCVDLLRDRELAERAMWHASRLKNRAELAATLLEHLDEPWMDELLRAQARVTLERRAS